MRQKTAFAFCQILFAAVLLSLNANAQTDDSESCQKPFLLNQSEREQIIENARQRIRRESTESPLNLSDYPFA